MNIDERRKYLHKMKSLYLKADRKTKRRMLDEMEVVTGLQRKTLIHLLHSDLQRKQRDRERGEMYGPTMDDALRVIAESLDYICPERLTPSLPWMAQHLAAHGELTINPALLAQLAQISVSTVKRRLNRIRQDEPRLPACAYTRAGRALPLCTPIGSSKMSPCAVSPGTSPNPAISR